MKPEGAIQPSVAYSMSQAGLEDALILLGNPDRFEIRVHPYAKHLSEYIAFSLGYHEDWNHNLRWKFIVTPDDSYKENEWSVSSDDKVFWCEGA